MRNLFFAALVLMASCFCNAAAPPYTVVRVDTASQTLQAFWSDEQGRPFRQFDTLSTWLRDKGQTLVFAMNAGMYEADASPVGLWVVDGQQVRPLNTSAGRGNFFLQPNGVFLLPPSGPRVVASSEYPAVAREVRLATQSGPLLLRNGVIHPAFDAKSRSRLIRNGVGVSGRIAYFVMSEQPVSFHELAVFFREVLHCQDALYLDGVVSSLDSAALKRNDRRADLGPMLGVSVDGAPGAREPTPGGASSSK